MDIELLTKEKIEENSYMIWYESTQNSGPCFMCYGQWYWSKDFEMIKKFIKEFCIPSSVETCIDFDGDNISDLSLILNEYKDELEEIDKDAYKSLIELTEYDPKDLKELNKYLYKLMLTFTKLGIDAKIYAFDSPFSGRALLETHLEEDLDEDFESNFNKYFDADILE